MQFFALISTFFCSTFAQDIFGFDNNDDTLGRLPIDSESYSGSNGAEYDGDLFGDDNGGSTSIEIKPMNHSATMTLTETSMLTKTVVETATVTSFVTLTKTLIVPPKTITQTETVYIDNGNLANQY